MWYGIHAIGFQWPSNKNKSFLPFNKNRCIDKAFYLSRIQCQNTRVPNYGILNKKINAKNKFQNINLCVCSWAGKGCIRWFVCWLRIYQLRVFNWRIYQPFCQIFWFWLILLMYANNTQNSLTLQDWKL